MSIPGIKIRKTCRACKGNLSEVLNLGTLRLNDFPAHPWEIQKIPLVPLVLTVCRSCGLAQLDRTVPPDLLYRNYWYRSGVNELMIEELRRIVQDAVARVGGVTKRDHVLDIGANDGTLLSMYQTADPALQPIRTAVEPALNLAARLKQQSERVISDYFPTPQLLTDTLRFKVITAIAMAYDLEDPKAFFTAIHDLLTPDGLAVVQFQDFGQQLDACAFDNICHEHLEYYTLHSLGHVLIGTGLVRMHVAQTPINGGSLRVYLRRANVATATRTLIQEDESVYLQLKREGQQGLSTFSLGRRLDPFDRFAQRIRRAQTQITALLDQTRAEGRVLDVYGASTKGNILLQVLGIGPEQVRQAIDRSPEKHGHYTITGIPIVGEETLAHQDPADVWLCPIWQFRESVLRREAGFLEGGGQIIFPLPRVEVVKQAWAPATEEI